MPNFVRAVFFCSVLLAACANNPVTPHSAPADKSNAQLNAAIGGAWRSPTNRARDMYRHPAQTLAFFGIQPEQTVVEITPGTGWYSEILAPYLRERGTYIAAIVDPQKVEAGKSRDYQQGNKDALDKRFAQAPAQFDRVHLAAFDPKAPDFGAPGSVDAVLTFRNVHNWVSAGTAPAYFRGFFQVLKPGGVLGVVEHRAKPGASLEQMKTSGYLTQALVITLAIDAGFVLEQSSEINANSQDDTEHPNGVWTLPPTNRHDAEDDAQYRAIGESDRMTLRFRKPG